MAPGRGREKPSLRFTPRCRKKTSKKMVAGNIARIYDIELN